MITARTNRPYPAFQDGPYVITLTIATAGFVDKQHKATVCGGGPEDPQAISSRWEAIATALLASDHQICDEMVREAWFASICVANDPTVRYTADRARGIIASRIGPERLHEIYQNAA